MDENKKLLLFDVDYTLVKGSKLHKEAIVEGIKRVFNTDAPIEKLKLHGMTDGQIILDLLKLSGFVDKGNEKVLHKKEISGDLKRCMDEAVKYYYENIERENTEMLRGVKDLLDILKNRKDVILGLLTGNIEKIAYGKLGTVGIADYFKVGGFGSDHIERNKLVDFAVKRAEDRFDFKRNENIVVIGDTPKDVSAAKEAGVFCIAVASGSFTVDDLKRTQADLVIQSLEDVNNFLEFINGLS